MADLALDVLTPKHVLFFDPLIRKLREAGRSVIVTTRDYREASGVLALKKIEAVSIGKHGGGDLYSKLTASAERTRQLAALIHRERPTLTISFSSPEMARVSFGLRIPHICVSDSPHAEAASRLAVPLSRSLYTPWIIAKSLWTRYGIQSQNIEHYHALDPWAWLRDHKPDPEVLRQLEFTESEPLIVVRPEEVYASYMMKGQDFEATPVVPIVNGLIRDRRGLQVAVLGRYSEQILALRRIFRGSVTIPTAVVDSTSLLHYATLFIGAGGTMTAEAALLGTPTISCYPSTPTIVEDFLINEGLVFREANPKKAIALAEDILRSPREFRNRHATRARKLTARMEDPVEFIHSRVAKLLDSPS